jgi:hypothetical protein
VYHNSPSISTGLPKSKPIAVNFNGGKLTSDAGALLLPLAQRIYALALGYEDGNDHTQLRKYPVLLTVVKNTTDDELPLGSAATLSRLENRTTAKELTECTKLFVELFIESFDKPPTQIILDGDATDDIIHGNQEGRHFNGFYGASLTARWYSEVFIF